MSKDPSKLSGEELSTAFANELSCENYFADYQSCLRKNQKTQKFAECVKIMDKFRYCLIDKDTKRLQEKKAGFVAPPSMYK